MEEKNKSKEIKMNAGTEETPKLTYEQLNEACVQLSQQNQYLKQQLQKAERFIQTVNRLDYLFRVVECSSNNKSNSVCFSTDFVEMCVEEIQSTMTMTEEETKETQAEN